MLWRTPSRLKKSWKEAQKLQRKRKKKRGEIRREKDDNKILEIWKNGERRKGQKRKFLPEKNIGRTKKKEKRNVSG